MAWERHESNIKNRITHWFEVITEVKIPRFSQRMSIIWTRLEGCYAWKAEVGHESGCR